RYPHLLPVNNEAPLLLLEPRPKGCWVAASAGFGEPEGEGLRTPRAWFEVGLPLLLGPPLLDGEHPQRGVSREEGPHPGPLSAYPLDCESVGHHVHSLTVAVLRRDGETEQVRPSEQPTHGVVEPVFQIAPVFDGSELLADGVDLLENQVLLVGGVEAHPRCVDKTL